MKRYFFNMGICFGVIVGAIVQATEPGFHVAMVILAVFGLVILLLGLLAGYAVGKYLDNSEMKAVTAYGIAELKQKSSAASATSAADWLPQLNDQAASLRRQMAEHKQNE